MQNLKNFKRYEPVRSSNNDILLRNGVLFFISENGDDWYESQKSFKADTLKIAYDEKGIIRSISSDVSTLYPDGLSIAEIPNTTANRRADISGEWCFNGVEVVKRKYSSIELQEQGEQEKQKRIDDAIQSVSLLQLKLQAGRKLTAVEIERLNKTLDYIDSVSAVDVTVSPIIWPPLLEL